MRVSGPLDEGEDMLLIRLATAMRMKPPVGIGPGVEPFVAARLFRRIATLADAHFGIEALQGGIDDAFAIARCRFSFGSCKRR